MKKKMIALAALLLAVVVTGYSVSGTYAKYTSTFTGTSDSAKVAKWAFKLGGQEGQALTKEFTFNLFDTINDTLNSTKEENIADGKIIAPGTEGSFITSLYNDSEVDAKYSISFSVKNDSQIPIEFSINGSDWADDLTAATQESQDINKGGQADIKIYWRWTYEGGAEARKGTTASSKTDADDTTLGEAGEATVSVTANINVVQVD